MCTLNGDNGIVFGSLSITQAQEDAKCIITGELSCLSAGLHALHVNVYGDLTTGGSSTGGVFNPFGKNHGSPSDAERRVGSLGNIEVQVDGNVTVTIEDSLVKLIGPHSIIGRAFVIHEKEDDLGKVYISFCISCIKLTNVVCLFRADMNYHYKMVMQELLLHGVLLAFRIKLYEFNNHFFLLYCFSFLLFNLYSFTFDKTIV